MGLGFLSHKYVRLPSDELAWASSFVISSHSIQHPYKSEGLRLPKDTALNIAGTEQSQPTPKLMGIQCTQISFS